MVEALTGPVWEVVADLFTCFVYGPANDVQNPDASIRGDSIWNEATDTTVDFSWCKEHHRMSLS